MYVCVYDTCHMYFYDVATIFLRDGEKFPAAVIFYVMPKVYSKGHNLKKFLGVVAN